MTGSHKSHAFILLLAAQCAVEVSLNIINESLRKSTRKCVNISTIHLETAERNLYIKREIRVIMSTRHHLTFFYGLCHFVRVLGEVKVGHVGLQVAYRAFSSGHTKSLYAQI